ncbi:hypothetical protein ACPYPG_12580 [Streptomyces sp. FR-108]|uniref:hypothetical protein n=1 Tax=Streptomyces sp. FR-108 TaxID=3416665 RepID=UPI003CE93424
MAENLQLVLVQQDQERLDKLADVRKDEEAWVHQRKYEQSRRRYLGEDVLKNTGSAVVWWLTRYCNSRRPPQTAGARWTTASVAESSTVPSSSQAPSPD